MREAKPLKWINVIGLLVVAIAISACTKIPESENNPQDLFSYCLKIYQNEDSKATDKEIQEAISYCLEVKRLHDQVEASKEGGSLATNLDQDILDRVYEVHPLFTEFYDTLGGEGLLGPAISPLFQSSEVMRQYVLAGLMEYEPGATKSNRYRLASLGVEIGIDEPPVPEPALPGVRFIDGQIVYHEFLSLYEKLGGARIVGRPLSGVRYNPEKYRIEQYFENLGFFRRDIDDPGTAQLLNYGSFACDHNCRAQPVQANILSPEARLPEPFASTVAKLGISFLGRNLTPPYTALDGSQQVIFDNLVLAVDPNDPQQVEPQPIVQMVGIDPHSPSNCSDDPLMSCFLVDGAKGYNIPRFFVDYLERYGWISFSGLPITSVFPVENGSYRQCFTNLCIDFDTSANEDNRIRLAPIGREYLQRYYTLEQPESFISTQNLEHVRIEVWESSTYIGSNDSQGINAAIFEGSIPLADREPALIVTMPDSSQRVYHFPPTNQSGMTYLSLPPIQAPNGTLVAYQVCLSSLTGVEFCVSDHFLIWNYP
jgi:hypothetical protein